MEKPETPAKETSGSFHALSTDAEIVFGYGMRSRSFLIPILKPIPCDGPRSSQEKK